MLSGKSAKTLVLAGANLTALAGTLASTQAVALDSPEASRQSEASHLNALSLHAMEGSWLKVPNACKAKGFNAEPAPTGEQADARILAFYASL